MTPAHAICAKRTRTVKALDAALTALVISAFGPSLKHVGKDYASLQCQAGEDTTC